MDNDAARRREDDQTSAWHEQAVAAGEKRLLTRTMDGGRLHSRAWSRARLPVIRKAGHREAAAQGR